MILNKENKLRVVIYFLIATTTLFGSCGGDSGNDNPPPPQPTVDLITNVRLPGTISVYVGQSQALQGAGFKVGDVLKFQGSSQVISVPIKIAEASYCQFDIPEALVSGNYTVILQRGNESQTLGKTAVSIIVNTTVTDKEGMNIKGVVFSGQTGLKGIRVSDGYQTTTTDANGHYWLNSEKKHGYVFITTPSGYQPKIVTNTAPGFWASLHAGISAIEQRNFELEPVDAKTHYILAAADLHLANRGASSNNDMNQFVNGFMKDVREFVGTLGNTPAYTFMLGDMSWETYWYRTDYDIRNYKNSVATFPIPMFHVMGNHDNDPRVADDFLAEAKYKEAFGPTYYSMDIGDVHYIFLDNTVYINTGGTPATDGERDYDKYLTDAQLQWLKEDLASITDKTTPIIVSFHCPSTHNYNSTFTATRSFRPVDKAEEFHRCFDGFQTVHFLSGHAHYNSNIVINNYIMEHTIAAVCETWWWAGRFSNRNVSGDGSPSGYKVFKIDGKNIEWFYKGINQPKTKQFRTYDMNEVKKFFARQDIKDVMVRLPGNRINDYTSVAQNVVYINVFNYDPEWTIEVKEGNTTISGTHIFERDPLHVLSLDYTRTKETGNVPTTGHLTVPNSHMFRYVASSPTSTLNITVKDRFGNSYTEKLDLPKVFDENISMD